MSDIKDWIERQIESGYGVEEVKEAMTESGRDPDLVDEVVGKERKGGDRKQSWIIVTAVAVLFIFVLFAYIAFSPGISGPYGVTVTREIERAEVRPGGGSDIRLSVSGSYDELLITEEVPEGFGVPNDGGANFDEESRELSWNLQGEQEIVYRVGAPGASTGTFNFNGTYVGGGSTETIKGDETIDVVW